jgi:hypothetical protein
MEAISLATGVGRVRGLGRCWPGATAIVAMACMGGGCRGDNPPETGIELYQGAATLSIPSGRPRLFFSDPARLAQARAWAQSTNFTPNTADAEELALHYLLRDNVASARSAIDKLMALQIPSGANVTSSDPARREGQWAILTYDWCYNEMSPAERETIRTRWNTIVGDFNAKPYGAQGMEADNYFWGYYRNSLMWAVASWHENQPAAQNFLNHALDTRWDLWAKPYLTSASRGKGIPQQGSQYGQYMLGYADVPAATAAALGRDLWNETGYYKEALVGLIYQTTPAPTATSAQPLVRYEPFSFGDDEFFNDQFAPRLNSKHWAAFTARAVDRWRNIPLGHLAQQWITDIAPPLPKYAQAVHTPISPVTFTRADLPKDYYSVANAYVYLRNNWTPNATAIQLQLGRAFGVKSAHVHADWGAFQMWRKGRWLTRETTGYSDLILPYGGTGNPVDVWTSVAHNVVLFQGKGVMSFSEVDQGNPVFQRMHSDVNHAFAAVDLSAAYRNSDVGHPERDNKNEKSLVREFLFIRPMETLVIFDRLESSSEVMPATSVVKTALLHFETNPVVNSGARTITATNADQVLEVRTLLPTATPVTYRTVTEGGVGQYRVEIDTSGTAQTYFLNVLQGRDTAEAAVAASVVDSGTSYDVTITHPTKGTAKISYQKGMASTGGSFGWVPTGTPALAPLLTRVQGLTVDDSGPHWEQLEGPPPPPPPPPPPAGTYWVDDTGSNSHDGSSGAPWATIGWAVDHVGDGSVIRVRRGTYGRLSVSGKNFSQGIVIRSDVPYEAQLRSSSGQTVFLSGTSGVTLEGFDIAHNPGAGPLVVQADCDGTIGGPVNGRLTFRNNVIHDSVSNDLLKINNGCDGATVEGNVFYNQSGSDEHMDVNSVKNVIVQDNIFFNDNGGNLTTSSFITVKDSNGGDDGVLGAQDVTIRRNVFLNYQGSNGNAFVQVGEDGHSYFEADEVMIENNLFLGNSSISMRAPLQIKGSRDITFRHNTVTGNLPGNEFALRIAKEGDNQAAANIKLFNNVWVDQTGTMNDFSEGALGTDVASFTLLNNAYWNAGTSIPTNPADAINYTNDAAARVANPQLTQPTTITLPRLAANYSFADGSATQDLARRRLIDLYARPGAGSVLVDQADPANAATEDILRTTRVASTADIGAYESAGDGQPPTATITSPASNSAWSDRVTVQATGSDNIGVVGMTFLLNGVVQGQEDVTAPYSAELDLTGLANGTYPLLARARDAAGNTGDSPAVNINVSNSCLSLAQGQFSRTAIAQQAGTFTATWTSIPQSGSGNPIDAGVGMSNGPQEFWSGASTIVLYDPGASRPIVVRNGGSYTALTSYPYTLSTAYRFRMVVDVPSAKYSVWVRQLNGTETQLANLYSFRTGTSGPLNHWMARVDAALPGSIKVCNFAIGP